VNPDPIQNTAPEAAVAPSTAGMTTKVVKGSLWTLAGQVAPLGVSLFTTPFVIRLLGSEGYGVLILVGLIPTYFAFADFGMGIASTKFASEAYAAGNAEKEARTVRTAALIALIVSLPVALALFVFSNAAITAFNVPPELHAEANLALKLASITFVVSFLNNIFNTPQLTRLRMDLNTFVNSGFRMFGLIATPIVIYLGGGILGAVAVLLAVALMTLAAHIFVSARLLNQLFQPTLDRSLIRPMLKFGIPLAGAAIVAAMLTNLEKLVLAKNTSVESLAFYSVAFTLASMATMLSAAMIQSLIPAFSQLLTPEKSEQLNSLFGRTIRMNLILILPVLTIMVIVARPFFTIWAGKDFGRESTFPFYVLLIGLFFHIVAYIPGTLLVSMGRTRLIASIYWLELFPYIGLVFFLSYRYGALGAAVAWSIRIGCDALILMYFVWRDARVSLNIFDSRTYYLLVAFAILTVPIFALFSDSITFTILLLMVSLILYGLFAWKRLLFLDERVWLVGRLNVMFKL